MQTPRTRAEFERHFQLLREVMRQGKFHVFRGMTLGTDKVRYLPNGRIDFLSVDESARLHANTISQFQSEKMKAMLENQSESKKHTGETTED